MQNDSQPEQQGKQSKTTKDTTVSQRMLEMSTQEIHKVPPAEAGNAYSESPNGEITWEDGWLGGNPHLFEGFHQASHSPK
jgi:hypothetical protein